MMSAKNFSQSINNESEQAITNRRERITLLEQMKNTQLQMIKWHQKMMDFHNGALY